MATAGKVQPIHEDEGGEIFYADLPDGFHAEFRVFDTLDALDVVLGQDGGGAADRAEVEATVLLAGVGHLLAAVPLGEHDHRAAVILEEIDIRVHAAGCCRAHRAAGHACRGLGRTCVVDRMLFQVLRHLFATVETFLDLRMGDVAADDDGSVQAQARADGVFRQDLADIGHRLVCGQPSS